MILRTNIKRAKENITAVLAKNRLGILTIVSVVVVLTAVSCYQADGKGKIVFNESVVLIDVRTDKEFSSGHIKGSVNIPYTEIKEKINTFRIKSRRFNCFYSCFNIEKTVSERRLVSLCNKSKRRDALMKCCIKYCNLWLSWVFFFDG